MFNQTSNRKNQYLLLKFNIKAKKEFTEILLMKLRNDKNEIADDTIN